MHIPKDIIQTLKHTTSVVCPYCNKIADLKTGKDIYPHRPDLFSKYFYECPKCKARCGCHGSTKKPLGTLTSPKLRKTRQQAHETFDKLWNTYKPKYTRAEAYEALAKHLNLTKEETHIAQFDYDKCIDTIEWSSNQ